MCRCLQIQSHYQNIIRMSKASSLRKTDVALMVTLPLTFVSGLLLHAAGHNPDIVTYKPWLLMHIFVGILLIVFSIRHIIQHWTWFKSLFYKFKKHSKITILTALSFILVSITGTLLVFGKGYWNFSHLSPFHGQAGLLFTIFAVWHCLRRINIFKKLNGRS